MGQEAVAKYLGITPDRTTRPRRGGPDLVYLGVRCDVKHCPRRLEPIWTVAGHKTEADAFIYIFTLGRLPDPIGPMRVWIAGWLPWFMLERHHKQRNTIRNPNAKSKWCYRVGPNVLLSIAELRPTLKAALRRRPSNA